MTPHWLPKAVNNNGAVSPATRHCEHDAGDNAACAWQDNAQNRAPPRHAEGERASRKSSGTVLPPFGRAVITVGNMMRLRGAASERGNF